MTLSPYPAYKPSGVDWLGDIPEHWEVTRLGSHFLERRTKVSDKDFSPLSVTKNGIVPQLDSAAKTNDGDNRKLVKKGDFVINSRSDRKGSSGVALQDGSVSLINIVVEPTGVHAKYCEYLLKSNAFIEEFYRIGHGIVADLWTTRYEEMKSVIVGIPPFLEQTAIATFLDQKTEQIEQAIAIKQQQIALLKERKQIIIQQAVTQGLNPNAPMKDSGVEWIGKIPEHWEVKRLKFLCSLISEKAKINGKTVIALENIESWTGKYVKTESRYSGEDVAFIRGDILFGKLRPYLAKVYAALDSGVAFGDLLVYRPTKYMFSQYCFYQMLSEKFIATVDSSTYGSKMPRASTEFIGEMFFLAPPLPEQTAIVTHIETQSTQIDQAIALQQQQIDKLKEYKTTLINSVVTGKVRVSDDLCDCVAQIDQDRLGGRYA